MKKALTPAFILLLSTLYAQVTQPTQPATGPGGSTYLHGGVTQYDYGTNGSGSDFWLYEPNNPVPDSANVVVFIHGLGETNPKLYGAFIKHLVRKGNVVIYPRYQKDLNTSNTTFNDSCAKGILRALDTLQQPGHVKGRRENFFVLGHSVGGVLTANMTMLHAQYGLPKPLTAFSIQPGAASFLMNDYSSFPADVKYLIAVGVDDIIVGTAPGNTLFTQTTAVPTSHKNLITQYTDNHGSPSSDASHFAPLASDAAFDNGETNLFILASGSGPVDGVDFYFFWKLQDALMDCALHNQNCDVAFGDTPQQRGMGNWSDGTPVRELEVTPSATTGISPTAGKNTLLVYPNPAGSNGYHVQVSEQLKGAVFTLTDVSGKTVDEFVIERPTTHASGKNLSPGIYFYQVANTDKGTLQTGKLSVQ